MPDLKQALKDFVATSNSGKYSDEETLLSKFPELQGYDISVLRDFVATSNSGKYATEDEVFAKFPEFNLAPQVKKKEGPFGPLPAESVQDFTEFPSAVGPSVSPEPTKPTAQKAGEEQGWLLNMVSSIDKGAYNLPGEAVKGVGTLLEGVTGKGFVSDALKKFGNSYLKAIEELTPQDESFKNTLSDQFGQAFGQVAGMVLTGGASQAAKTTTALSTAKAALASQAAPKAVTIGGAVKKLASELSQPAAVGMGLAMGQGEFERAKQAGASDDQAFEAFYKNAVVGSVLENIPVMQFLKRFNKASAGGVVNYLKTKAIGGLTGGTEEMTTEVLQQLYANQSAQDIYNINQDLFEGVGESGGIGFGVGFLLNAMGANAKLLRKQGKDAEAEVIENQMTQFENAPQAPAGPPPIYSVAGVKITDPVVINDMIDNMDATDLVKSNIEITNDPELNTRLQNKIVTSSIKEQVREANPNLTEEQLDEVTNLEKELRKFEGNTTQSGKDKAAAIRSQIKTIQENAVQEQTAGEVPVQPRAGVSETLAEGEPQAEPQVPTTEGVEEVVTTQEEVRVIDRDSKEEFTAVLQPIKNVFNRIKDSNFSSLKNITFEELVKNWDEYKNIDNEDIKTIKYFIENPHNTAIVLDKKEKVSDGNHRIIADMINNKESVYTVNQKNNPTALGDLYLEIKQPLTKVVPEITRDLVRSLTDEQITTAYDEIPMNLLPMAEGVSNQDAVYDAYIKSKQSGKNPELVKAVEDIVSLKTQEEINLEAERLSALLGTPSGKPKFRIAEDVEKPLTTNTEAIETEMNNMPSDEIQFSEPSVSQKGLKVNPVSESNSIVKVAKKVGDALMKPIQYFNGIPMIMGMSDILAAGKIKDSSGNDMDVEGGLLFNVLGKNKNAAWAGVTEEGAQNQYNNAVQLYNSNKELFDRLWDEGKLPSGHIPMAIMRMADTAVNSNEAIFRWALPTVESFSEDNKKNAMNAFNESMNEKLNTKVDAAKAKKILDFIKEKNIISIDEFFKQVSSDANLRAKGSPDARLNLDDRSLIYDSIFAPSGIKTASKPTVKALLAGTDGSKNKIFTSDFVYNAIGEPSMLKTKQGEVVSVVGIDVKNGGVFPVEHGNYGFGPKGQTIALIENPTHGTDVFPEFKAKTSRVFKESKTGEMPSSEKVASQTGGAFFTDKAFRGAKVLAGAIDDMNLLIGKLRFAFPSVSVSTTQEEFDNIINSPDVRTSVSNGKVILGLTKDGKIYINPEMSSLNTPIHEFGHIWIDFLRSESSGKKGTELLNKGLKLVKGTEAHKKAVEKYGDTELALEEALVELMANKGATIIDAAKRSKFKSWMNAVFKYIQQKFTTFKDLDVNKIKKMKLEDFINTGLADLFSGKEVSAKFSPEMSEESLKARLSAITDINEIVKIGRENGISEKAITKVLKDRGFSDTDIRDAQRVSRVVVPTKPPPTMITVNEMSALKDQIRLEARAAREAKADLNTKRKQLSDLVRKMGTEGKISINKVNALVNKIGKLNLDSQIAVDRFIDYAGKLFKDAEYASKLSNANNLRKDIKKLSKSKDKNADLRDLGQKFSEIDPSMVEDIDAYNDMASKIKESIKGSTIRGQKVSIADVINIDDATKYIDKTLDAQDKLMREEMASEIQELMGIDVSEFSYDDMMALLESKKPITKYNEGIIRDTINKAFGVFSSIIKQTISTGKDPFTEEDIEFSKTQKDLVKRFMDMDLNVLKPKDALQAVDALYNFLQNKSTAKMETVVSQYTGIKNAKELSDNGVKASRLQKYWSPWLGKFLGEQTTNLNILFERMFKGFERGGMVMDKMGLTKLFNGKSLAERESNNIVEKYVKDFYNTEANGETFNSDYNNVERGMAAFIMRSVIGTEAEMQNEFNRRKGLIEESISVLSQGNDKEKAKAELYQRAYDKIIKDSQNIKDISTKVDPTNLEAIEFWKEQWANKYEQLSDVSKNVYNKILDKDLNYVPDKFFKLSSDTGTVELDNEQSAFLVNSGTNDLYQRETGVLMSAVRPETLPVDPDSGDVNRYIDLSFDNNNANSMYDALVDINTAAPIRQIQAFLNSSSFKSIVPESDDATILKDRIQLYVRNIRDKNPFSTDEMAKAVKALNKIAAIGVGQALGGVTQPIKQVIPVAMNTVINAGGLNIGATFNKDKNDFITNSGYAIANRGVESQAQIESINKLIDKASNTSLEKGMKFIEEANKKWLELFLVKPDVYIARASWLTYYEQNLKKQGIDTKNIDYKTHELNEDAANYAQRMVDRQQNVSDIDLAGKLFSGKEPSKQLLVKTLMPFASFRMNQAARLGADLATLMNKTSSSEDKKIAARSVAGYGVEMVTFRLISIATSILLGTLAKKLMDRDEDDEERKKRVDNIIKGAKTGTFTDIFSPLPIADKLTQEVGSAILNKVEEGTGMPVSIFEPKKEEYLQGAGLFGISVDRAGQLWELSKLATTGEYTDDFGRKKKISENDMDGLKMLIAPAIMTNIGLAPSEVNSVIRNAIKDSKKKPSATAEEREAKMERDEEREENLEQKLDALEEVRKKTRNKNVIEAIDEKIDDLEATPEEKKQIKEENKEERERKKELLTDPVKGVEYDSESKMKRYNKRLWNKNFGPRSQWYKDHKYEKQAEQLMNKEIRKQEDKKYKRRNSDGSLKRTYGNKTR